MAAAAERVPPGRVVPALGLRLLAPARLRRPHLLGAQHPQEARAAGHDRGGRLGGVPAHRRELTAARGASAGSPAREGRSFYESLSGPFFKN